MDNIEEFKQLVKRDFIEWKTNGECRKAINLNNSLKTNYFDTANPQYFTGNVLAEVVLIHLNPKRNYDKFGQQCSFQTFEDYWSYYEKFGQINYGINSPRKHKSPFDYKQIRFLKPFNVLQIDDEDKYQNLENVVDQKLQLELIPYGSPNFKADVVGTNNILPYLESITNLILASERKHVFFCGKIFNQILSDFIIEEKPHYFKLIKNDGLETRDYFNLFEVKLQIGNKILKACIVPQFAKQGAPISQYGKKIAELIA